MPIGCQQKSCSVVLIAIYDLLFFNSLFYKFIISDNRMFLTISNATTCDDFSTLLS